MSSVRSSSKSVREQVVARGLRATNWPLRDKPYQAVIAMAGCTLIGVGCGILSQSISMGLLACVALAVCMWKLWVPVTTEFEPRGIVLSVLGRRRRISWREIDHLEVREGGVFLCTESVPLRRSAPCCVFLPWGPDRESIVTFCEDYRPFE